jgi:hypothetical protein
VNERIVEKNGHRLHQGKIRAELKAKKKRRKAEMRKKRTAKRLEAELLQCLLKDAKRKNPNGNKT